jgi:hypothetical protein
MKKFAKWGEERSITALEHSLDKGYQGVYEPTPERKEWKPEPSKQTIL